MNYVGEVRSEVRSNIRERTANYLYSLTLVRYSLPQKSYATRENEFMAKVDEMLTEHYGIQVTESQLEILKPMLWLGFIKQSDIRPFNGS